MTSAEHRILAALARHPGLRFEAGNLQTMTREPGAGPKTKGTLKTNLGRSAGDIEKAISTLFAGQAIQTVIVKVRGVDRKAFTIRQISRDFSRDEA